MRGLTPAELAQACKMRDEKWRWTKIGAALHIAAPTVRDALVAAGYPASLPGSRGAPWSDARCQRVYEMHVYEGLTFAEIARRLDAQPSTVGRVVKRLRKLMERKGSSLYPMPYRKPEESTVCVIGNTYGGEIFCAQKCERGACGVYVTRETLTAFDAFQARRREIENNDEVRRTRRAQDIAEAAEDGRERARRRRGER